MKKNACFLNSLDSLSIIFTFIYILNLGNVEPCVWCERLSALALKNLWHESESVTNVMVEQTSMVKLDFI